MKRDELAAFLRSRRERLTPQEAGLPGGERRRTPGLRRQEVAQLAGMSIDYYIRLEQARGPHPSRQVLNALARALMLSQDERAHLFLLGGHPVGPSRRSNEVPASMLHLLSFLEEVPAYVLDAAYNIVAFNPLGSALLGDLEMSPGTDLNVIRWCFLYAHTDHFENDDQLAFARASVADLRAAHGRYPDDPEINGLVTEMIALSPAFARLWAEHEVELRRNQHKRLIHPKVGEIKVICQMMPVPDRDDLRLVLYTAEPGSPSHLALRRLRELTLSSQDARTDL
ncbi:helix-turn-helix transcriptional regulator [Nonomuraea sp. NPDC050663]|uniref:helix-turn-helix transcriptional regulator n=1 Tax=Nonomuraea sp. NPDC050663 TaxID=3364370 RepID=UPI003788C033